LTTTTIYHDTAPVALEIRSPGYTTATAGHVKRYTYYGINNTTEAAMGLLATRTTSVASPEAPMPSHQWLYNRDWSVLYHFDSSVVGGTTTQRVEERTYDPAGRLSTSQYTLYSSATGTVKEPKLATSYDTQGNVSSVTSTPDGQSTPTKTILSSYDSNGNIASYQDASASTTVYAYNIDGDLQSTTDPRGTYTYTYNARGLPSNILNTSFGGSVLAFYDNDDHLKSQFFSGTNKILTWDPAGNRTDLSWGSVQDHVKYDAQDRWVSESSFVGGRSQTFSYDTAGRVEKVEDTASGGVCTTRFYVYDGIAGKDSNRTSVKTYPAGPGNACSTTTTPTIKTSTYDSANRLVNAYGNAVTHDGLARVKTAGTLLTQAGYFADDHPSVLTQGGVTQTYTEDPAGRTQTRQAGTVGAPVETYHYADGSDSPSWSESGTTWTQHRVGADGELLASKASTGVITVQYTNLHGDVVGSTGSGTYDEFGNAQTANGRQYGWLGGARRSTESAGGLIQMGERTYLAPLGRFLQTDPVDGGSANDYDYTNQDPINATDLDGRCPWCVVALAVAVRVGVAALRSEAGRATTAKAARALLDKAAPLAAKWLQKRGRESIEFGLNGRKIKIARHDHPSGPHKGEHVMYKTYKQGVKGSGRGYQSFRDQNGKGRWGPR
jgi:RHS repeat-associated protein